MHLRRLVRSFSLTYATSLRPLAHPIRRHQSQDAPSKHRIRVTFVDRDGTETTVMGAAGQDLLRLAHANDIELEGACEGSLACSTCHVILDKTVYDALPAPSIEEDDMLDLAFGLTNTSRLGCQVKLDETLNGMRVTLPHATRNMAVDGFKPKPH